DDISLLCCLTIRRPPTAYLFPYTTLFRSGGHRADALGQVARRAGRQANSSLCAALRIATKPGGLGERAAAGIAVTAVVGTSAARTTVRHSSHAGHIAPARHRGLCLVERRLDG